jgi:hypothetical protein
MNTKKLVAALGMVAIASATLLSSERAYADAPEFLDTRTPDIGITSEDPILGTVIHINPMICSQMGPLVCGFFRKHEQGHANRGHTRTWWYAATTQGQRAAEAEADCVGAKASSDAEATAAIAFFRRMGMGGDVRHGTGFERAAIVQRCHESGAGESHEAGSPSRTPMFPAPTQLCTQTELTPEVRMVPQMRMQLFCGFYGCQQAPVTVQVPTQVMVPHQVRVPCGSTTRTPAPPSQLDTEDNDD